MRLGIYAALTAVIMAILIATFAFVPDQLWSQGARKKHQAELSKVALKKWRIKRITAGKGDEVSWSATDSDLYFQFTDDKLFGEYHYTLRKQNTLTLEVKGNKGTYFYSIFSIADSAYVEGNSPPTIIIP
jgi:hypothetical protein